MGSSPQVDGRTSGLLEQFQADKEASAARSIDGATQRRLTQSGRSAPSTTTTDQYEPASERTIFEAGTAIEATSSDREAAATEIQQRFGAELHELAGNKEAFHQLMKQVYGKDYNYAQAEKFRLRAEKNDFTWLPNIEFQSNSTLQGGYGAYDAERNVIYLNENLLGNLDFAAQVYAEEVGHFFDTRLAPRDSVTGKLIDTAGDEGELFRRLLAGEELSRTEIAEIRSENDHRVINVNGKEVEVEFFFKKLFKGIKKIFSGVKKFFKKISGFLSIVFTVMTFIPGLNLIGIAGNMALNVYAAAKRGDWAGAVFGAVGALGGGATNFLGKAAGMAAQFASKAQTVFRLAQTAFRAYQAVKSGNILGFVAGVAGGLSGLGANVSGRFGEAFDTISQWAGRARTAIAVWRAVRTGDYLGAIGVGAHLANDFAPAGSPASELFSTVTRGALTVRGIEHAIRRGDYLQASQLVTGVLSDVTDSDASRELGRLSSALGQISTAHDLIRGRDFAGAAIALTSAASEYGLSGTTRQAIESAALRIGQAAEAFRLAEAGDLAGASQRLFSLTEDVVLDRSTRVFLSDAARVFQNAVGVGDAINDGRYFDAAFRLERLATVLPADSAVRSQVSTGADVLRQALGVEVRLRNGDFSGARTELVSLIGTLGLSEIFADVHRRAMQVAELVGSSGRVSDFMSGGRFSDAEWVLRDANTLVSTPLEQENLARLVSAIEFGREIASGIEGRRWSDVLSQAEAFVRWAQTEGWRTPPILPSAAAQLERALSSGDLGRVRAAASEIDQSLGDALSPALAGLVSLTGRELRSTLANLVDGAINQNAGLRIPGINGGIMELPSVLAPRGGLSFAAAAQQAVAVANDPILAAGGERGLTEGEIALARSVFGDSIDYSKVKIHRESYFPFGLQQDDVAMAPNGEIYFDPAGTLYSDDFGVAKIHSQALFIHEMTHVWQHQQGTSVRVRGIFERNYQYLPLEEGKAFAGYSIEQQGDIVRDYFYLKNGVERENYPSIDEYRKLIPFVEFVE